MKLVQNQFRTGLQLGNLLGEILQKIWGNFQVFGIDLLDICGFWEDFGEISLSQSGNTELVRLRSKFVDRREFARSFS